MKVKYEYLLHVWGGFWNKGNMAIHNEPKTEYMWFDTKEERQAELDRLLALAKTVGTFDSCIASSMSEGYLTRYQHILRSLVKVDGKIIEVENNLGYGFFSDEKLRNNDFEYMRDYKWDMCADLPDDAERLFTTLILKP